MALLSNFVYLVVLLLFVHPYLQLASSDEETKAGNAGSTSASPDQAPRQKHTGRDASPPGDKTAAYTEQLLLYRKLFRRKREAHHVAIDTIKDLDKYEKQHKMITLLLGKLFKTMRDSQVELMSQGFTPGDPFPTNETTRDIFSNVLENTAFFGDMLLRLPDIVHDVMKKNREWDLLIRWGVGFSNSSSVLEAKEVRLLNLMSQELGIIEKDDNYINPYKEENIKLLEKKKQEALDSVQKKKKTQKKKKKEKRRGPRLSGEL